jgi:serine/threonine protein kinase
MNSPIPIGTIVAGKYRVEGVIGKGGMGFVLAATDTTLTRRVAIKCLRAVRSDDATTVARFTREARAAANLQSEYVARVFDAGTLPSGIPYIVMELLDGKSLADVLKHRELLPIASVVDYALQACDGLIEAHARGVVHRDLKPANLFLARSPTGPSRIKLLDFGISKLLAGENPTEEFTPTGVVFGSPRYMSPEQLKSSKHVDQTTDIWSLGTIVYELLVGKPAFPGPSLEDTVEQIRKRPTVPLTELRPDIPSALAEVVGRCLEKECARRYPSMLSLAEALVPLASTASTIAARFRSNDAARDGADRANDETIDALMLRPQPQAKPQTRSRRTAIVALSFLGSIAFGAGLVRLALGPPRSVPVALPPVVVASSSPPLPAPSALRIAGAVSPDDRFARAWAEAFEASQHDIRVHLEPQASSTAIDALLRGTADLAIVSRAATQDERARANSLGLTLSGRSAENLVAVDAVAVIVNPENPIRDVTLRDIRRLFDGEISDWSYFGGKRRAVSLLVRPDDLGIEETFRAGALGTGTRYADSAEVVRAAKDVTERVRRERDALSIVSLEAVGSNKALRIATTDGERPVAPSSMTVRSRAYPIVRPIFLYARTGAGVDPALTNLSSAFVDYVLGDGQNDARRVEAVPSSLELIEDRDASERVSQACGIPPEPRRKYNSDYRFRNGALVVDDLAVHDLDRMAENLCAPSSPPPTIDLAAVLERGARAPRAALGARERASAVRTELLARCPTLQVRCVTVAPDAPGASTRAQDERDVGRVEVWISHDP